mmetsp:Transcript_62359/g.69739  ORF Transcript_62359/g.69739 Transcript_62359/m.69739 type:complete len:228 (-) Transcript_62359:164-847(-)|eukprot:CAMPEP_0170767354 /NCGR_PEP_ID=MMETSP0733-20121128/5695_1 /TAXON_ID=186038 /ORGANISM="Fragilariopsis kerguelensis, Strain L26-C5" /LENGTH=227 /DNA_ID=CAMNT_0011108469 /DNA_START=64 /DNA_END=747 /DNA_ORIENTATION=+
MVDDNKMMTLTYFDLMGRAEAARMVLTHGQVEFHDHRVSGESWAAFKASEKCPSGQLPVLEDEDGVCMNQSQAITRYCAVKTGIYNYSTDPKACFRDDMIICTMEDFANAMPKANGKPTIYMLFGSEPMPEEVVQEIVEWRVKEMTKLGEILGAGPFFGGTKPSLSDFWVFGNQGVSCIERNPKGKEGQEHFYKAMNEALPSTMAAWANRMAGELSDYLAARPNGSL